MTTLVIIIIQLILAFAILSLVYLFVSFLLRQELENQQMQNNGLVIPEYENHIALFYTGISNESQLLSQVQWLIKQDYKNFSAFFFCPENIVEFNGITNIKILNKNQITDNIAQLSSIANHHFPNHPSRIVCVNPKSKLSNHFLFNQNVEIFNSKYERLSMPNMAEKTTYNLIKQSQTLFKVQVEFLKELINSSNTKTKVSFNKLNTNIHFVLIALLICSISLILVNSLDYFNKPLFDLISLIGILFGITTLINLQFIKNRKRQVNHGLYA